MDKTELLREMRDAYEPIAAAVAAIPADEFLAVPPGMNAWTRKDVVAHLEVWHRDGAALLRALRTGIDPDPGGATIDIDAANARAHAASRDRSAEDVRRAFADSFEDLAAAVAAATDHELFDEGVRPWASRPAVRDILAETSAHYAKHASHLGVVPRHRAGALRAVRNAHRSFASAARASSDESLLAEAPGMPGWTRKDVLAHVEWWNRHSTAVLRGLRSGVDPYPDTGEPWDIDTHNARVLAESRARTADDVRAGEAASFEELMAALEEATDHELFDAGVQPWLDGTAIAMVAADTWDHYPEHEPHLAAD